MHFTFSFKLLFFLFPPPFLPLSAFRLFQLILHLFPLLILFEWRMLRWMQTSIFEYLLVSCIRGLSMISFVPEHLWAIYVLTIVIMKRFMSWDIVLHILSELYQHFGGKHRLHLQGGRVNNQDFHIFIYSALSCDLLLNTEGGGSLNLAYILWRVWSNAAVAMQPKVRHTCRCYATES
jgi:hypothetical protein